MNRDDWYARHGEWEGGRCCERAGNSVIDPLLAELANTRYALRRAVYLAEHLFQMISPEEWRATGGDDGQGHYEGDYRAETTRIELTKLASVAGREEPGTV